MIIRDLALNEVEVTDSYLKNAFRLEKEYLLSLDADRLLAGFYEIAGKTPKKERYPGGWEDQDIAGHTMGHYLTALAQVLAATGEEDFSKRLNYMIDSLEECQTESGYLSAFKEELFDNLEQGKQAWVPWYTMHKILGGLISVYQLTGIPKALNLAVSLGNWVYNRVKHWDDAMKAQVLATEYGGMNDCLYELYKETGKIEYMMAAEKFDELPLFDDIRKGNDILDGKHANTTIPKFLGALNRYLTVGDDQVFYLEAAKKFFDTVLESHTYVTGGNSEWEHFGQPKVLAGERTNCNCETCNTYNMLKLARGLFRVTGEKRYLDFYEGTFWNAIVSSQNPKTGMSMYFQPMATGYFKVYSRPFDNFWCCTGTGMENFTKLNDSIYYKKDETLYLGMYISSRLVDKNMGIDLKMTADLPANNIVRVEVTKESEGENKIAFRRPAWSEAAFSVTRKGKNLRTEEKDGFVYVSIEKGTTEIEAVFAPEISIHPLPDAPQVVAFKYGPLVLSAGLGSEDMATSCTGVNVTVPTKEIEIKDYLEITSGSVEDWMAHPEMVLVRQGNTLNFRLSGTDEDKNLVFSPHYARHEERYGIYWELRTKQSEGKKVKEKEVVVKQKKEKQPSVVGRVLLLLLALLLVAITSFVLVLELSPEFKGKVLRTIDAWNGEQTAPTPEPTKQLQNATSPTPYEQADATQTPKLEETEQETKPAIVYLENLEYEAALANEQGMNGFMASVKEIDGKRYLSFTNNVYTVSYKHDASAEAQDAYEVIISNGEKTQTYFWEYYAEHQSVKDLCPKVGNYCGNDREQLVFSFTEYEGAPVNSLHVVAGNTLTEYYVISPWKTLEQLVEVEEYLDAGSAVIAKLKSGDKLYHIALEDCDLSKAKEQYPLKNTEKMAYVVGENEIRLESYVTLGEGSYVGKISGAVAFGTPDLFMVRNPLFYMFADDDFCDLDSMSVGVPVTEAEIYIPRFAVSADDGERILVPILENVLQHEYAAENFQKDENGILAYYEDGKKVSMTGIDVSKWQGTVNWKKVKAAGVEYAMIRLGYRGTAEEGKLSTDPKYVDNIKGATSAGLHVGVYFFTQARTVEEAIEEANFVLENLKGYKISFPVVYDTEHTSGGRANELSNAERTACAKAFCDTILAAGYTPVIYSGTNWTILDLNFEELQMYDFWFAYYGETLKFPYNFTMWQYSNTGTVNGISGDVDLNISFVDYSTR